MLITASAFPTNITVEEDWNSLLPNVTFSAPCNLMVPDEAIVNTPFTAKVEPLSDSVPVAIVTSCPEAFQSAFESRVTVPEVLLMVMSPSGSSPPWSRKV
ncbi:MAG: hypothetical protein KCHDKBKB_02446 [Elusimicrobia bacterium]|nr:hypothetical protein [Elusimicrobiota bacterium]